MSTFAQRIADLSPKKREMLLKQLNQKKEKAVQEQIRPQKRDSNAFPLSFAQQRLWFLDQLEPGSTAYNIPVGIHMQGKLNVLALEQSLQEIVRRHEALRTTFATVEGTSLQIVAPTMTVELPLIDLREVPGTERKAEAQRLAHEEMHRPFDLARGPLLRSTLLRLEAEEHVLLLTMHHIVSDGWSMGVFIRELTSLYKAFSSGQPSSLPELPLQYADYTLWQQQLLKEDVQEKQLAYWKKQLDNAAQVLELPTDHPRPAAQTYRGSSQSIILPPVLANSLKDFSQKEDATLFMVLLAAFQMLLSRYSGQEDIVVGTPIANRTRGELEALIGFFVNTLVMRTDLSGTPSFRELVRRVRRVALGAYANQDLPFEQIVDAIRSTRDLSRSPLFQVMFILQNAPTANLELGDLTLQFLPVESNTAKFDLTLSLTDTQQGLFTTLEYNTDLFESGTITRMLGHYQVLLEGIVANPEQPISSLPIMTTAERQRIVGTWNDTQSIYAADTCIHQLFEDQAARTPDAVAVVYESTHLTYRELNSRANQLAHYLQTMGIGPEDLVGLCVERSLDMVIGVLGILKTGAAYLPLDPSYPQDRLAFMLQNSRASLLLTHQSLNQQIVKPDRRTIHLDADWWDIAEESEDNLGVKVHSENIAYVIYTSGSTGRPKGVLGTHRATINRCTWMWEAYPFTSKECCCQKTALSFVDSIWEIFGPLLKGVPTIIIPDDVLKDIPQFIGTLAAQQVTRLVVVPSLLRALLDTCREIEQPLLAMNYIITSGEALSVELLELCQEVLPQSHLLNLYGSSEVAADTTYYDSQNDIECASVPIGHPLPNTQAYLLDQHLQLVPIGVPGELYIGGDGLARGYIHRPELTVERFIPNPFGMIGGARLYKTGDVARHLPDGTLEYLGRSDHQVKIRGFRIEMNEIESILVQHPTVQQALVLAHEDIPGNTRLVAYIVASMETDAASPGELRNHLQKHLPTYMIPSTFMHLEAFPLTPNGKVDRKALPAPDYAHPTSEHAFAAPHTITEQKLSDIWQQVLRVERVGIYDNFFTLGGDSILSIQIVARANKAGIHITPKQIFQYQTIAELAAVVSIVPDQEEKEQTHVEQQENTPNTLSLLTQAQVDILLSSGRQVDAVYPLSPLQHGLLFHTLYAPESGNYITQVGWTFQGDFNAPAWRTAWQQVTDRHAILRTSFVWEGLNEPMQVVRKQVEVDFAQHDWRAYSPVEQRARLVAYLQEDRAQGFDLLQAPLMRLLVIQMENDIYEFVWTHHHILLDGWSFALVLKEVFACYEALCQNTTVTLEPPRPYHDYISWLKQQDMEQAESFWQHSLQGFSAPTPLGIDRLSTTTVPGGEQQYEEQVFQLSTAMTQALQELAREHHLTLNTLLQGAWAMLLSHYSGQDDIIFGTTVSGRPAVIDGVESMVGLFINTLPVRVRFTAEDRVLPWLHQLQHLQSEMRQYEYSPLVQVQGWSEVPHGTSLFESLFVFENFPLSSGKGEGIGDLTIQAFHAKEQTNYPLSIIVLPGSQLTVKVHYDLNRIETVAITRLQGHLRTILEGMIAHSEQPFALLPYVSTEERQQVLAKWNDTRLETSHQGCIHQAFEEQVERTPTLIAVGCGSESLTYRQLNERANQLAHLLQALGVGPDRLVGLCMKRSMEMVVGLLAILKAGGAYVPLDPSYPQERLAFMLNDAQLPLLVTQEALLESLPEHTAQVVCIDRDWGDIAPHPVTNPFSDVQSDNLAYVIYTSGSTGQPKATLLPHRGAYNLAIAQHSAFDMQAEERVLQFASLNFDASVSEIVVTLLNGATLCIPEPETVLVGQALLEILQQQRITLVTLPPSALATLPQETLPELRTLVTAGEVCPADLVTYWAEGRHFINAYGPTEATVCATVAHGFEQQPSIGTPIANVQAYLLDALLQPIPVGVTGEVYIAGVGLARGYLNRPALTAERFVPHPFSAEPGARLYKTGDLARYRADGQLEFLGRIDHQVKVRGYRIELGEIESALSQHDAIEQSVVLASEDDAGSKRLIAYIVTAPNSGPSTNEVRTFLQERLPEYMIPLTFVQLKSMPIGPNGKVDRQALLQSDATTLPSKETFAAAHTTTERALANIWAQVLRKERVGIHDNFFTLGGDSILSIQIVSQARQVGIHMTPRQLFQHPTIAELATTVVESSGCSTTLAEQGAVMGDVPLTPIQHWFFEEPQPEPHHWNQAILLATRQPLDAELLRRAVAYLLQQHDALRLRFVADKDGWQQIHVELEDDVPFTCVDLSTLTQVERDQAFTTAVAEAQTSLNLATGPLLRVVYFDSGTEQPGRLLIVIHHLVVDGVSWRILLEDLRTAYEQLKLGQAIQLPPKTTSFQQWAQRLTSYAQSAELRQELSYWLAQAERATVHLPVDYSEGDNTVASTQSVAVSLSTQETQALLRVVPEAYRTQINDVLLTALAQALAQWTGEHQHLIHLEGHGREDLFEGVDLSRTIGWFTSLYPLVLQLSDNMLPAENLKAIKEQLRQVPQRGIGYGLLRYLSSDTELIAQVQAHPEAEIGFNYLGQFDQSINEESLFGVAPESTGQTLSPQSKRQHLIDVNASVISGQLHLHWTYSEQIHRRKTIENVAHAYVQALRELITHCQRPEVGGYTPSDFPLASLTQEQIDTLLGHDRQIEAVYPLSPLQQGLLFHTLYAPESGDYVIQVGCTFKGKMDVAAFAQAWQRIMNLHAILRTGFAWEHLDQPQQVVRRQVAVPFVYQDWRKYPSVEQQALLTAYLREDRVQGFTLTQAPLMRLTLIQMSEDSYEFVWSHHHILLDGWSLPLVLKDVFASYEALREGTDNIVEATLPYQEYIAWLQKQDLAQAEHFWRQALHGFTTPTSLGVVQSAGTIHEQGYEEQNFQLSSEMTQALQQLARDQQITLNTVLQGAWALLLNRYSRQDDVVFGTIVSGRPTEIAGVESIVGLFINTLPMRVRLDPATELTLWLQSLQLQQSEMRQYEYSSLSQVQSWSDVERGLPLFESLFVFENYPLGSSTTQEKQGEASLSIQALHTKEQTSYPLTLACIPGSHLLLKLLYDRSRFQQADISRLQGHLLTLLENMLAQPTQPLATLCLLAAPEQQALLTCNATHTDYPHTACIHTLVEAQVARTPDAIAVSYQQQSLTYRQLNARANQLAHALHALGVAPNQCVGVYAERSLHMIVSFLAILKVGAAYLPLDLSYPQDRISFMLQDAQATVLLTQHHLASGLTNPAHHVICLDTQWSSIAQHPQDNLPNRIDAHHLAYVIYTSGSTGRPKGVCISHQAIARLLCNTNYIHLTPSDVVAQASNASFDAATFEIWGALLHGAHLVGISKEIVLTPQALAACLRDLQVTTLFLTTALFNQIAQSVPQAFQSLRHLLFGGEAVDPGCVRTVLQQGAPARLLHVYGPTESTTFATWKRIEQVAPEATTLPIGSPLANTQTYLLDQHRCPVPTGVPGELYIGGDGLAQGYLRRPELTAETFVPHPWSPVPGARLYRTGDLGRMLADGSIEFLGRLDQQVKMRGLRIELGEIEGVLAQQPAVRECAVVARQDPAGNKRLVAYVVWTPGQAMAVAALRALLHDSLPDYMVPSTFVMLESLPLTPNGKVDRRALPAPDHTQMREETYVAPRSVVEQTLATIWGQVLGVEQVGIHDNFFALGGDSILSIQIVARANQAGIHVTPKQLFQHQAIAELATVVDTMPEIEAEQGTVTGEVPLTPIQHWFFEQQQPEAHYWNQATMLMTQRPLDLHALEDAIAHLLIHHDALRLRFKLNEDGWQQSNAGVDTMVPLTVIDLTQVPVAGQGAAIEAVSIEMQASLNLSEGPLLRVVYFDLGTDQPARLLIIIHHLAVDGVSWRILLEDLQTAYEQLHRGQSVHLPAKTTSFKQWAQRLTTYAQSSALQEELSYWVEQAAGGIAPLPIDHTTGENTIASAQTVGIALSVEETQTLLHQVPQAYRTQINDVLLTALAQTLTQWTGQQIHLIHLEGHGREDLFEGVNLSRTVGWFTSIYPVILRLDGHGPAQALKSIKEQLRALPQRGIGYGLLRYLSENVATLESMPEAEISFNYLGQFGQSKNEAGTFVSAPESGGPVVSPLSKREHLLDINGSVSGGQLCFSWAYSQNTYRRETIDALAHTYLRALREIIVHCQQPEAGGYTPSDFPLASLTQAQIDALLGTDRLVEAVYPLSPLQQGLLFHTLYAPGEGDYVTQVGCTFRGTMNAQAFAHAWQQVIDRYSILRTGFMWENLDKPIQIVRRQAAVPFEQEDWRMYSADEQQRRLSAYLHTDRVQGFDLAQAPLMRLLLIQKSEDTYEFVWSHHHLLLDGWSLPLVLKDVFACYHALCVGHVPQLEQVRPYQHYIAWLSRQDLDQARAFWQQNLQGFIAPTPLGIDRTEGRAAGDHRYAEQRLHLSAEITQTLQCLAREHQLTLNTVVQGVWALLLSRYSGQQDVVFGTTVSGRPAEVEGVESMVGLFINTLPVRVRMQPEASAITWMQALQAQQTEMRQYEYSPLVQVQSWSEIPRGLPLFESLFVFENYPLGQNVQGEGQSHLAIQAAHSMEQTNYPLTVVALPGQQLTLKVTYDLTRFETEAISRMLGHLHTSLASIANNPLQALATLPMLTSSEDLQMREWNAVASAYTPEESIHERFEAQVQRQGQEIAVRFEQEQLSYEELNRKANQVAHHLQSLGVGPNVRVGLCVERSLEMILGILGILKAGGTYVPLDPTYPRERLTFMVADAQMPVLVTLQRLSEAIPVHEVTSVFLDMDWPTIAQRSTENPAHHTVAEHIAYIIYTSGSTGKPKGVCVSHANVLRLFAATDDWFHFAHTDVWTLFHSYAFDFSTWEIWGALLFGGQLIVVPYWISRSPENFYDLLQRHQVTVLNQTPSAFRQLLQVEASGHVHDDLALRYIIFGGERLDLGGLQPWYDRHGEQTQLVNMYGITETTVHVTYHPLSIQDITEARGSVIGRAIPDLQLYVLDPHMQPVPVGVAGELYVGGAGLAQGYLQQPALTSERFVADPFGTRPGARLYKTGDLTRYLPSGNLEYLGRSDEQVKIRGFRIELGEIETELRQHPAVRQGIIIEREDYPGNKRLVAYVVADTQSELTVSELRTALQQNLPYYMVPSAFVLLDALPLTSNGKVDRRALPAPDYAPQSTQDTFAAASTTVEHILAEIWRQVLGVEKVGIHDNFFEMGGDSILSIQIVARARQMGVHVTPKQLFQYPTIGELAAVVGTATLFEAEQGIVTGEVPLTPIQHWFFEQQQPEPHHWNQAMLLATRRPLDPTLLKQAVSHLLRQHDALRLRFTATTGGWQQSDADIDEQVPLTIVDLSTQSVEEQRVAIERIGSEAQASLNLETGPLMRVVSFNLGDERPARLLIAIHHLAVDGVSWRILLEDLQSVYEQLVRDQAVHLPAKTTSFQQWARRLTTYAQSESLRQELPYWIAQVSRESAHIPIDYPAGDNTLMSAQTLTVSLSVEETRALLQEVPQSYHTQINDVLLTALLQAVAQRTGQRSLRINLEGHGREDILEGVDLSRTVGWFTSLFPVLLDLGQSTLLQDEIKSIKEQLRQIPQRGVGYGVLRYLSRETEGAHEQTQLEAEISFNYLGQFDQQVASDEALFVPAPESSGATHSPLGTRQHALDVSGNVINSQLHMNWTYSQSMYRQETIEMLAHDYMAALRDLIAHCQAGDAGGYTPSDFPEAEITQKDLDKLVAKLSKKKVK